MIPKYSVIIPTFNHCSDLLRPCLESIIKHTDLSNVEVLVSANGCKDDTREYVESLGEPFKMVWSGPATGFTKATNDGIKASTGEYIILLNNDTVLLDQKKNTWIDMLVQPFADPKVGITGPMKAYCPFAKRDFMIFFCVCIPRKRLEELAIYEEKEDAEVLCQDTK